MQIDQRNQITTHQAIFIVFSGIVGISILTLPQIVAAAAGNDAWLAVLLGGIVPLIAAVLIHLASRRLPGLTFVGMMETVFGAFIGKIFSGIVVLWGFALIVSILRHFSFIIREYLLTRTPLWVIILLCLLLISYLAMTNLKVVGRACELFFYLVSPLYLFIIPPIKEASFLQLLPVGQVGLLALGKGALSTAYAFSGMIVWLIIIPFIKPQDKVLRTGFTAAVLVILTYTVVTIIAVSVFGGNQLTELRWPALMLLRVAEVPIIERIVFFFLLFWIPIFYRIVALHWFIASATLAEILRLRDHKKIVLISIPVLLAAVLMIKDISQLDRYANVIGITGFAIDICLPLLLLLGAIVREKGAKCNV